MREKLAVALESVPGVASAPAGATVVRPRDLLAALRITAGRVPSKGIRFCSRGKLSRSTDYPEILAGSIRVGDSLRGLGLEAGERVAIILPTCPEFFPAFFGVMDSGGVPVPLPQPLRFSSTSHYLRKIRNALIKSRIRFILADQELARQLAPGFQEAGLTVTFLQVPDLLRDPFPGPPMPAPIPESDALRGGNRIQPQALIQYTSGSTADSKGVVLTHAQVLANLESMRLALEIKDTDVGCSWLPLFHDMGLIGCALLCVYTGMDLWLMPPGDFLRAPENWLGLFGPRGITISPAPNSAFRHCLEKIPPVRTAEFDLRSWRAAINGAEPIHLSTLQEFEARFSAAGFRSEAMLPVYGLAEATLAVTFSALTDAPKSLSVDRDSLNAGTVAIVPPSQANAKHLISVGKPVPGMEVSLADPDGSRFRGEDAVGEILVRGPSVMEGYDFDTAATGSVLDAGWLKTGDMGFLHAGELYVTGRRKEMFIINGQNYYAHDFETLAQEVAGVAANGAMAVKVLDGESESVVMIIEARAADDLATPAMVAGIREIVCMTLGINLLDIFVVKRGLLPKTSSGKLERHQGSSFYADVSGKYLSLR